MRVSYHLMHLYLCISMYAKRTKLWQHKWTWMDMNIQAESAFLFFSSIPIALSVSPPANDFDLHGQLCENRRPSRSLLCPPFGIQVDKKGHDQAQVQERCEKLLGFEACPKGQLLPSGECGTEATRANPFDCVNDLSSVSYMPCYDTKSATVDHFYQVPFLSYSLSLCPFSFSCIISQSIYSTLSTGVQPTRTANNGGLRSKPLSLNHSRPLSVVRFSHKTRISIPIGLRPIEASEIWFSSMPLTNWRVLQFRC